MFRSARSMPTRAQALFDARVSSTKLGGRVIRNSGWLIGERLIRMGLAFIVTIWVIRYLGDDDYGVLAYALSLTLLADVVATLGLRSVVVRELVEDPDRESEIMGTTIGVKLMGSLIAAASIIGVGWLTARDATAFPILVVLAISLPFNSLSALDLTFQAFLQSQYAVAARTVTLAVSALVRIALLIAGAPLIAFAMASAIELGGAGLAFATMYAWKRRQFLAMRFRPRLALTLVGISWPFFMSALAASVYLKVDQVMLGIFTTSSEVGQYAAAARLSEVWYFIPVALASSLLPMFVVRLREGRKAYGRSLQRAFDISAWMALSLSIGITIFAVPIVAVLYGSEFDGTADILRIHTWAAPFIFMGTVLGRAIIAEDRRRFELVRHSAGAILNVTLNLVLIPRYGGVGAALATVISYAFASYFACLFYPPAHFHLRLMTRALLWPLRLLRGGPFSRDRSGGPPDGPSGGAPTLPPPDEPPPPERRGEREPVARVRDPRLPAAPHSERSRSNPRTRV